MKSTSEQRPHKIEFSDIVNSKFYHIKTKKHTMKPSSITSTARSNGSVPLVSPQLQYRALNRNGNALELSRRLRRMKRRLLLEYVYGEANEENENPSAKEKVEETQSTPRKVPAQDQSIKKSFEGRSPRFTLKKSVKNDKIDDSSASSITVESFSFSDDDDDDSEINKSPSTSSIEV